MTAAEWYAFKSICGDIYQYVLADQRIPDELYYAVLQYLHMQGDTLCDYYLYGSCQYSMVTLDVTLLYNDSKIVDKRQVFIFPTPARHKQYIPSILGKKTKAGRSGRD